MTRAHKGNYRDKHPEGTQVAAQLQEAVSRDMVQGRIACVTAFAIAERLRVVPMEVGKAIDLQEGRIHACQLDLFGFGANEKHVQKAKQATGAIETAIQKAIVDGRLPCRDAWRIADLHQLKRIEVSRACEAMQIKICQCQLGAF